MKKHEFLIFGGLALLAIVFYEKSKGTPGTPATGAVSALPTIESEASVTFQNIQGLMPPSY